MVLQPPDVAPLINAAEFWFPRHASLTPIDDLKPIPSYSHRSIYPSRHGPGNTRRSAPNCRNLPGASQVLDCLAGAAQIDCGLVDGEQSGIEAAGVLRESGR